MRAALLSILAACNMMAQSPGPEQLFRRAVEAEQRGDLPTAVLAYRELLKTHPEAVQVRVNLGGALAAMGNFDEAIEQYRSALAHDPGNPGIHLNLALALHQKGDLPHSAEELTRLHHANPSDARVSVLLADCNSRMGKDAEAIAVLLPAEAAHGDDLNVAWELGTVLIKANRLPEGIKRIEKVAARGKNADAELLSAEIRLRLDQYDQALPHADAALRLNPKLAGAHTIKGMILEHSGDFLPAKTELREALQADAKDFNAHLYLGSILYFERQLDLAREQLEQALQLDPSSTLARYQLALCKRAQGQMDAAVKDLEEVARKNPRWAQPHVELAALYYRLKRVDDGARERKIVDKLRDAGQQALNAPVP